MIGDLERAHLSVWHDQELRGGDLWWRDILRNIRDSDVFVFALSKNSLTSKPCLAELSYARALRLPVLPVLLSQVGNVRTTPVADVHIADYRERTLENGLALLGAVEALVRVRQPMPDPLPEPPAVPFAYLLRLSSAITSSELSPNEQGDFIRQLQECLETEEEESVKDDARELLRALRHRPDVTYRNAQHIDRLLDELASSDPSSESDSPSHHRAPSPPYANRAFGADVGYESDKAAQELGAGWHAAVVKKSITRARLHVKLSTEEHAIEIHCGNNNWVSVDGKLVSSDGNFMSSVHHISLSDGEATRDCEVGIRLAVVAWRHIDLSIDGRRLLSEDR